MVYTALQRVSVNGTTYKIGETIQTSDAKALEADGLGYLMKKDKGIEDNTPPTPPKPPSEKPKPTPTPAPLPPPPPEDPKTDGSEGTDLGSESNAKAPKSDDEDPEDIIIGDPDIPPATSSVNLSSPEAVNLLSKKM